MEIGFTYHCVHLIELDYVILDLTQFTTVILGN